MEPDRSTKVRRGAWMLAATIGIAAVIFWLVRPTSPRAAPAHPAAASRAVPEAVRVEPGGLIVVAGDSPLCRHLDQLRLRPQKVTFPLLTVSGSILARIRPGGEALEDRWQFASSELAGKYADWLRTTGEIDFARNQLAKTKELVAAQTDYLAEVVRRLEPSLKSGSVPEKNFKAAQAELLKAQLQGEKDIFSAQSTLRVALKTQTALERDLSQTGIEAVVFGRGVEHMVLIAANVPETHVSQVREGQGCVARFYAYPARTFDAHVETLSSLLSHERRTLRVLFELSDPEEVLRPGMFAEVGLGTDEREALLVPAEALLHVNLDDYVVVAAGDEEWKPVKVRVGEQHDGSFEVLQGLSPADTVITRGAILLKPAVMQALSRASQGKK
ncbi:MAG: efflux RND transporter periplasmic adaptor subunit [Deltaproteobacteria bacterium]